VVDLDARVVTAASKKEGALGTSRVRLGFIRWAAGARAAARASARELRPGNAGANAVAGGSPIVREALINSREQLTELQVRPLAAAWSA